MRRRYVLLALTSILAVALTVPALGGPSNPIATGAASAKKTAKKALKKAKKKAQQTAKAAQSTADGAAAAAAGAQSSADSAQSTADGAQASADAAQASADAAQATADAASRIPTPRRRHSGADSANKLASRAASPDSHRPAAAGDAGAGAGRCHCGDIEQVSQRMDRGRPGDQRRDRLGLVDRCQRHLRRLRRVPVRVRAGQP